MEGAWRRLGAAIVLMAGAGCAPPAGSPRAGRAEPAIAQPAKMTAQPAPTPPGRRVSNLLDFEAPQDLAFITTEPVTAAAGTIDSSMARSGSRSLLINPGTLALTIKTPALLQGRPFPADWTLLGGYVYVDQPTQVTLRYESGGRAILSRSVALSPRGWTPIMLDLTTLDGAATSEIGIVRLYFATPVRAHLDDVMLVDNHETVIDTDEWSVRRDGLAYTIDASGKFAFKLPTAQAQQGGWAVVEACEKRVRFASSASPGSATVYSDGRVYWGEAFHSAAKDLSDASEQARQHAAPAEITMPESMGRRNRSSAGDANNDGYNETRGAYEIVATGSRIEMTITPHEVAVSRPVLEIAGLPAGPVRATMEGRLLPGALRLPGGEVLVELPGQIEHPTMVNVRVR